MREARSRVALCAAVVLAASSFHWVLADEWGPIEKTEFVSTDRTHLVKITPHPEWPDHPGFCKAELFLVEKGDRKLLWSRYLINDHAPVRVYVADDGSYVVTMDEWHHVGRLPVVIYGENGRLIRVHDTETLGLDVDSRHIILSVSSFLWNEDALVFFGPHDNELLIRLHWGRDILLDLHNGDLIREGKYPYEKQWKKLQTYMASQSEAVILQMLQSQDSDDRRTAAIHAGHLRFKEAIPLLRRLLTDESSYLLFSGGTAKTVYDVRSAAKAALEAMGEKVSGVVVEERRPRP